MLQSATFSYMTRLIGCAIIAVLTGGITMSDKKITTHVGGAGIKWPTQGPKSPEDKKRDEAKKRG